MVYLLQRESLFPKQFHFLVEVSQTSDLLLLQIDDLSEFDVLLLPHFAPHKVFTESILLADCLLSHQLLVSESGKFYL